MSKVRLVITVSVLLALLVPLVTMAQEPEPGAGGLLIEGSTRSSGDIRTLMPLKCSGVDCRNPILLMFPGFIGIDPVTQDFAANLPGDLATGWEVSEDGLTYTVTIRDDMTWNDGTPITTTDVYFSWLMMQQDAAITGLSSSYGPAASALIGAEIVDETTIKFMLETPSCEGLRRVASVDPMPAHAYGFDLNDPDSFDWGSMLENDLDLNPTVSAGPFQFNRLEPGTAIYLEPNQSFPDATHDGGGVLAEGWVFLDVPDENVLSERFLAFRDDDVNLVREIQTNKQPILDSNAHTSNEAGRIWHYVALNLADPNNPQAGLDADGNPIDQGHHPLFGDVRVRQALQHGINVDEIINGPLQGHGTAMVAGTIPGAWTLNPNLERRATDLDEARRLLDEAGFPATGDPLVDGGDGLRIATEDALYAEPGTPFIFELMNVGDVRGDVAVVIQDQLAQIGVQVDVSVLDFNAMYDDNMGAQTFDAAVAGWRGDLPFNPDQRGFFGAQEDRYGDGYGFNFGSWYNAEFEAISEQIATIPGCDPEERRAMAWRVQDILWEEQPYLWLYAINSLYAAAPDVQNFQVYPNFMDWNADALFVAQ